MKRIRVEDDTAEMLESATKESGESYDACIRRLCGNDRAWKGKLREFEKDIVRAANKQIGAFKTISVTAETNAYLDIFVARNNETKPKYDAEGKPIKRDSKSVCIYNLVKHALLDLLRED